MECSQEQRVFLLGNNFLPLEGREAQRLVFVLAQDTAVVWTRDTGLTHNHLWQPRVQDVILWASNSDWLSENRLWSKYLMKGGSTESLVWWELPSWNCWMLFQGVWSAVGQKRWCWTSSSAAAEEQRFGLELLSFLRRFSHCCEALVISTTS